MKVVRASLTEGFAVKSESRGHVVWSDEPRELGGADSAQKPSELLLSALASCKVITCKMYAQRKMWKLDKVEIELFIDDESPLIIHKRMHFSGNLDEDQLERLKAISGRCPVARMLHPDYEFQWME